MTASLCSHNLYVDGQSQWSSELIPMTEPQKTIYSQYLALKPNSPRRYHHLDLVVCKTDFGGGNGENFAIFIEYLAVTKKFTVSVLYKPTFRTAATDSLRTFLSSKNFADIKVKMSR